MLCQPGAALCLLVLSASPAAAQSLDPGSPAKEYIRLGERVVAIEAATAAPAAPKVGVSPSTATLGGGQSQQFTASVVGLANQAVTWSISPNLGTVTTAGLYTAPSAISSAPPVTVTATSVADPGRSGSATVTLYSPATSGSSYPVIGTFLNFYRNLSPELWAVEFDEMRKLDISNVVVVSVGHLRSDASTPPQYSLAPDGLLYPSGWVGAAERPANDRLEMILSLADQRGMRVYLGSLQTEQDWSTGLEFDALRLWNRRVASEVVQRYGGHRSLQGWYFAQELWMNWVKAFGPGYYGTALMANWAADMKQLDPTKTTTAAVVFKKDPYYSMPGLTPAELQSVMTGFLQATRLDLIMPQDGAGAEAGAPPVSDLPGYYQAMAAARDAAGTGTALWSTVETFTADPTVSNDRYPPADALRIDKQVNSLRPYVSGYVSWIFGNDMSPQATYYPVEASALNRAYRSRFRPQAGQNWGLLPLRSYQCTPAPAAAWPDNPGAPKLSDRTGGGYSGYSLADRVGFREEDGRTVQIVGDLGARRQVRAVRALAQSWLPSAIFHPQTMSAEVSDDGVNWTPLGTQGSFPSDTQDFSVVWGEVDGAANGRYVRWTFTHLAWLFLAELEVLGPPDAPPPPAVGVTLSPTSTSLSESASQQFTAAVSGTADQGVAWSLSPMVGSLANGLYTAPDSFLGQQSVLVRATSAADPSRSATATVNLVQTQTDPPTVGPMSPDQGSGPGRLFSFEARAGSGSLKWVQVLVNDDVDASRACYVYYDAVQDVAVLSDDGATNDAPAWRPEQAALGTPGLRASNSQCTLDYENSSAVRSGAGLTLNLSLRFAPGWAGTRNVYMATKDSVQQVAWPYVGYWKVTAQ